jgi:hypothetical protein
MLVFFFGINRRDLVRKLLLGGFLLTSLSIFAGEEETQDILFQNYPVPWFTGPLIAPSGYTVKPGHFKLQSYFDIFVDVGRYNSHWKSESIPNFYNLTLRCNFKAGLTKWMDVQIVPRVSYKETQEKDSAGFGDLPFGFNFQLIKSEIISDPWPAVKLILGASIPTGKYEKLNPSRKGTDAMGNGCWYPEVAFVVSKLIYLSGIHYLETRLYTVYRIGTPTSVKGISVYGGDKTTHGVAYPGNIFIGDVALEYNLTQRWALACDFYYLHRNKNRFSGKTVLPAISPSQEQFSLAPAIEYNWSKNVGAIGGIWFSVAGRNAPRFINGILSVNAYF